MTSLASAGFSLTASLQGAGSGWPINKMPAVQRISLVLTQHGDQQNGRRLKVATKVISWAIDFF
jgi:hypothetical protein